jgi:hypothetical protein
MLTVQATPADPFAPARYATTVWGLHWASFSHQAPHIFPEAAGVSQTALVVGSSEEASILIRAAFPKDPGAVLCVLGGRDLQGRAMESLQVIHPWTPGAHQDLTGHLHSLEITLNADHSNLEDLAFQVYREFNFVADILQQNYATYLLGSGIMAGQFQAQGWAVIPGFRKAHGKVGRLTSPPPEDF